MATTVEPVDRDETFISCTGVAHTFAEEKLDGGEHRVRVPGHLTEGQSFWQCDDCDWKGVVGEEDRLALTAWRDAEDAARKAKLDEDAARVEEAYGDDGYRWDDLDLLAGGALTTYVHEDGARWPVNLARLMREGVQPPEMALDEWLVAGELHWCYADAESAKTWLALILAMELLHAGKVVVWFDEELGEVVLTERLLALGASEEEVERRFAYFPFPSWQVKMQEGERDIALHRALVTALRPALVVYDTATDALSEAELDENYGIDVTTWVKAYPEEARRAGSAQLVLDHTTKDGEVGKHAVGSRAKRAKAKVQYALRTVRRFDRVTLGQVSVKLTKNTRGAYLPVSRQFECGGDGAGNFVWTEIDTAANANAGKAVANAHLEQQIEALLRREGKELSSNQVVQLVGAKKEEVLVALKRLGANDSSPVVGRAGTNRSVLYSLEPSPSEE